MLSWEETGFESEEAMLSIGDRGLGRGGLAIGDGGAEYAGGGGVEYLNGGRGEEPSVGDIATTVLLDPSPWEPAIERRSCPIPSAKSAVESDSG